MNAGVNRWQARRKEQLELADLRVVTHANASLLIEEIAAWLRRLALDMPASNDRDIFLHLPDGAATLPDALRGGGLSDWARDIETLIAGESPVLTLEALSAERAIGSALGLLIGRQPDEPSFNLVSVIIQKYHDADEPFWLSAQLAVSNNANARETLLGFILSCVHDFTRAPRRMAYIAGSRNPCELTRFYYEGSRFRDVWLSSPYSPQIFLKNASAYSLLLRLDPDAWTEVVDLFPSPEPVAEIVRESCLVRPYLNIAALIGRAASPFDVDENWQKQHKLVFPLLQAAEEQLQRLSGPASDGGDALVFERTLKEVCEALGARADVSRLGHAWLEEIAWKDYARNVWQSEGNEWEVSEPLARIFHAVATVVPPLENPLKWIEGDDDVWCRDRLVVVLAVMSARHQFHEVGQLLLDVAKQGLATSASNIIEDRHTLPRSVIGGAIVALDKPADFLRELWGATFLLRDRARHLSDSGGQPRRDLNITCTVWGMAALSMAAAQARDISEIWIQVMEMIRETEITRVLDTDYEIAKGQRMLAALWSQAFPVPPQGNVPGSLKSFLSVFAAPDLNYMSLLLTLEASGVELADIAFAAGGTASLRRLAQVVLHDLEREAQRGRPNVNGKRLIEAFLDRM